MGRTGEERLTIVCSLILLSISNWLRPVRYGRDIQLLKRLLDPKKDDVMLDVGAGTGAITNILADVCDDVFAVEPNEEKLEFMKKKYPQIKGLSSKVDAIPFPDSYFTKIFAVASFHHFDNQDLALDELCRLLKPSGLLLIHEIEPSSISSRFEKKMIDAHFLGSDEIARELESHGFFQVRKFNASRGFMLLANKQPLN